MPFPNFTPEEVVEIEKTNDLIEVISQGLITSTNKEYTSPSPFGSPQIPDISLKDYLIRMVTYLKFSETHLIYMMFYLTKYTIANPNDPISIFNSHRLCATALLVTDKFIEDDGYALDYFSKVTGIPVKSLMDHEVDFLFSIQFELYISLPNYILAKADLVNFARSLEINIDSKKYKVTLSEMEKELFDDLEDYHIHKPADAVAVDEQHILAIIHGEPNDIMSIAAAASSLIASYPVSPCQAAPLCPATPTNTPECNMLLSPDGSIELDEDLLPPPPPNSPDELYAYPFSPAPQPYLLYRSKDSANMKVENVRFFDYRLPKQENKETSNSLKI
jgi:hypothetical protein